MRALVALLLAVLAAALPARAAEERVVAALSQSNVAITTSFQGSEIFIYGAIKRTAPLPEGSLDLIITVTGPAAPVVVRKKERRFGIWVNDSGVKVDSAPSLYAVASTRDFFDVISHTEDLRYKIGLDHAVRLIFDTQAERYPEEYRDAVIRLRRAEGLYFEQPGGITVDQETLFRTSVALPAQLTEGDYSARIYLLRDKQVIDIADKTIAVRKVGLERWIYTMAKEQSAIYGLMSIAVALFAGWAASAIFRLLLP